MTKENATSLIAAPTFLGPSTHGASKQFKMNVSCQELQSHPFETQLVIYLPAVFCVLE